VSDERTAVLSEIDDLRMRYIGMERRLEAETENHCKALDQLRDERESRYVGLSLLFKIAHPRDYASKLLAREETEATRQQQRDRA